MCVIAATLLFYTAMSPRTLRAANSHFYIGCTFAVIFACVYVMYTRTPGWGTSVAIVFAGAAVTLWGAYYASFSYRVNTVRISRISLFSTQHIRWEDISSVSYDESDSGGIASCKITISSPAHTFEISSDVLNPDAVRELADDLRKINLLPPTSTPQNS